jgi:hypothetical protein
MRGATEESGALLDKKRLGKKQKARLATLLDQLDTAKQPPATPTRPVTGLDEHGLSAADNNGGAHWRSRLASGVGGSGMSMREQRRASRFGRYGTQPMRSRIQRTRRKTRTGGVK